MEDTRLEPEKHLESVNSWAHHYVEENFAVLPAEPGEKESRRKGWPNLILGAEDLDKEFPPGENLNIVRVNGENSGGHGDIDIDCEEGLKVAPYILPEGLRRFGREGQELGHVEIRFADTVPCTTSYSIVDNADNKMVVELRAN